MIRRALLGTTMVVAACAGPTASGPIEIRVAADARTSDYLVEYDQEIEWGTTKLERIYRARYALTGLGGTGDSVRLEARLDSLHVVHSTPHGRGAVDSRHLIGLRFELVSARNGGRPAYPDSTPVLHMPGNLEGELSVSRFMDFAFPELPDGPVEVGASWTRESSRPQVEAHVHATATITTEYRLVEVETVDGVDRARIEGTLSGTVIAPPYDLYGATVEFNGEVAGVFEWLVAVDTGRLVSVEGSTTSDGVLTAAGNDTRIKQVTRIRIAE